jgi:hypothetical protein
VLRLVVETAYDRDALYEEVAARAERDGTRLYEVAHFDHGPAAADEAQGFSKGVRGKYAKRYAEGTNIVVLAPDVAEFFPDSESVNAALRALVGVAQKNVKKAAV